MFDNNLLKQNKMNYCIFNNKLKIGFEIPINHSNHTNEVTKYATKEMAFILNSNGKIDTNKGWDYTSVDSVLKWGYNIILVSF